MSLPRFIVRALILSLSVSWRMIPILAVAAFAAYLLVDMLLEYILAFLLVFAVVYIPAMLFLYLCAVRAGLVALRASGPPDIKQLLFGTWRLMRFQFMLNNLVLGLFGFGGTVFTLMIFAPDLWQTLSAGLTIDILLDLPRMLELVNQIPIGLNIVWAFALSISAALLGTSIASTGASCAVGARPHDLLWGFSRQFGKIFAVAFLVLVVPAIGISMYLGGPLTSLWSYFTLPLWVILSHQLYFFWAYCVICAAQALAYVQTCKDNDQHKAEAESEMFGTVYASEDLRAIRLARQQSTTLASH